MSAEESAAQQSKSALFVRQGETVTVFMDPGAAEPGKFALRPGDLVDNKYQILEVLGVGGMGAVYKANHVLLHKEVAFKTFKTLERDSEALVRFQREAQSLAKLNNSHVVLVFDYGFTEQNLPYYTMEYLQGESLADKIRRDGPLDIASMVRIFADICDGLDAAHKKGILHRDIKPSNIFLQKTSAAPKARLVDFGLASVGDSATTQSLTAPGLICGSPLYMSPEQARGEKLEAAADIYSLGASIYEALTGRPPIMGESALETIMMRETRRAPSLAQGAQGRTFPPILEKIIATMLQRNPGDRQQSLQYVIDDLEYLLRSEHAQAQEPTFIDDDEPPEQSRPTWLILAATAAILCAGALTAILVFKPEPAKEAPRAVIAAGKPAVKTRPEIFNRGDFTEINWPGHYIGAIADSANEGGGDDHLIIPNQALAKVEFDPDFLTDPANFEQLRSMPIPGLQFPPTLTRQQLDAFLPTISAMHGLTVLSFGSTVADEDLKQFESLSRLQVLTLRHTEVTGDGLARFLKRAPNISNVQFSGAKDLSPLLVYLAHTTRIYGLILCEDILTQSDAENIGKIAKLNMLNLSKSNLTDSQLKPLVHLKHANDLSIEGNALTPACVPMLTSWSAQIMQTTGRPLNWRTTCSGWADKDVATLKKAMPFLQVRQVQRIDPKSAE